MSDVRADLAAAGAHLAALGLSPGSSGNLSVRDGGLLYITPTGAGLARLDPDGLSVLDGDGAHLEGPKPGTSSTCTPGTRRPSPACRRGPRGAPSRRSRRTS